VDLNSCSTWCVTGFISLDAGTGGQGDQLPLEFVWGQIHGLHPPNKSSYDERQQKCVDTTEIYACKNSVVLRTFI